MVFNCLDSMMAMSDSRIASTLIVEVKAPTDDSRSLSAAAARSWRRSGSDRHELMAVA
jgi:hypothetical protein